MRKNEQDINKLFKINPDKAFQYLYNQYFDYLIAISIPITHSATASEDIIQEVFIKLYQQKLTKSIDNYESYLFTATKNASINYIERTKKHINIDQINTLVNYTQANEKVELIKSKLYLLPPACKEIFEKIVFDEWTYDSVAFDKNISINTVKTQMRRAYAIIRKNIGLLFLLFFN